MKLTQRTGQSVGYICGMFTSGAMLTCGALLRHFRKRINHGGDRRLHTLIS